MEIASKSGNEAGGGSEGARMQGVQTRKSPWR
jgi:hypothetical protein